MLVVTNDYCQKALSQARIGSSSSTKAAVCQPLQPTTAAAAVMPAAPGPVKDAGGRRMEVHVVTKVWYTHLGYEHMRLSVESLC